MIKIPMLVRRVRVEKLPTKDRNVRMCVCTPVLVCACAACSLCQPVSLVFPGSPDRWEDYVRRSLTLTTVTEAGPQHRTCPTC